MKKNPPEKKTESVSYRCTTGQKEILEAWRVSDGLDNLAPMLEDAVNLYIATRVRYGKAAVQTVGA